MSEFLVGLYVAFSLVAIVFFLRFWRATRDSLFLFFSGALLIMALERVMLAFWPVHDEATSSFVYVLRLIAFSLIIWAMACKNRRGRVNPPAVVDNPSS